MFNKEKNFAYVGIIMGAIFIFCGIGIFVNPEMIVGAIPADMQNIAGFILVLYGAFRIYRSINVLRNPEE